MARLHITKLAASERQLRAALRFYFADEDELAIHTVAAAAYRVLSDLKAERGMDEAADAHLTSVFYVVRDYRRGTLPSHLTQDPEFMAWVTDLAEELPITAEMEPEDVQVTLTPAAAGAYWNQRNKVANFLKHADRRPRDALPEDEIDNLLLLMQAYSAYRDLSPEELGNEGLVFQLYLGAKSGGGPAKDPRFARFVSELSGLSEQKRRQVCNSLLEYLNTPGAENGEA